GVRGPPGSLRLRFGGEGLGGKRPLPHLQFLSPKGRGEKGADRPGDRSGNRARRAGWTAPTSACEPPCGRSLPTLSDLSTGGRVGHEAIFGEWPRKGEPPANLRGRPGRVARRRRSAAEPSFELGF